MQDPNTEFTDDQYRILVAANYVPTLKYRRAVLRQQQGGNSSGVASLRTQNESLTRRLAVVEGIMNAQQSNETPTNAADETITVDSHSTRPNSASNGTRPNSASNGTQFGSGAYKRPRISGIMSIRRIQQVKSDVVQGTTQADTKARIESDSHADTCALGSNFLLVETTEWTCTVQPFHKEYAAQDNIPVVTGATAYDDPATGETVILIFHQSLWFGSSLENSLICPQQVRSYGVSMCDDPYDPNRPLGMKCEDGTVIPFNVKKSMIGVTTRCPSLQEYESCRHLVMTSPQIWDPTSKDLPHHSQDAHVDSLESWHHVNTGDYHIAQSSESDSLLSSISSVLTPQTFMEKFRSLRLTSAIDSQGRYTRNSADTIAKTFQVSLQTAHDTISATTQHGARSAMHPIVRRYRTDLVRGINARQLPGKWYTDTFFSKYKSIRGHTCAQLFTNRKLTAVYPLTTKAHAGVALREFVDDVGIPNTLIFDNAAEQTGPNTDFMKTVRQYHINWKLTEPYAHWQNKAENEIREVKRRWKRSRMRTGCSPRLWDHGMIYESRILGRIARGNSKRTGYEEATGQTPDISEDIGFMFYDPVHYITNPDDENNPRLGRWLGPSHRVGGSLCYWILNGSGNVVTSSSVQRLSTTDLELHKARLASFDNEMKEIIRDENHVIPESQENCFFLKDIEDPDEPTSPLDPESTMPDADEVTPDSYDTYLGARLLLPVGGERMYAKVTKRLRRPDGKPMGTRHENPLLDTQKYEVEFEDGHQAEYFANVLAENLFSQVDDEGREHLLIKEITGHRTNSNAVTTEDGYVTTKSGRRYPKKTTIGWELCVEFSDETTDWLPLKDLKESHPVQVAEYAESNRIQDEPAFKWWVPYVLKKTKSLISKVAARYWRTTHKFGIQLPHSVAEAYKIDKETGTLFWTKAIEKEMGKIHSMNAFLKIDELKPSELRQDATKLPGHAEIGLHMVFDIKMDGKNSHERHG